MGDSRVSLVQDLAWRLEAVAFALFTGFVRALPTDTASDLGAFLFKALGPLGSTHKLARENLILAFPEKDEAWRQAILKAQWDNTGRTFFEFPIMDRIRPSTGRVEMVNAERLRAIAAKGEAVVFVSGHFANWEVMPAAIVDSGVICQMTYRAANNPYVDRQIRESRYRYGVRLFAPKGGDGARELLDAMKKGESVALMNDQKFNRGGVEVDFFGRKVMAAPGPSRLAQRFGTVLQPMTVERLHKATFRAVVHDPIEIPKTGDKHRDIEAGVQAITDLVEEQVRQRPEEWFWVHRRWPNDIYPDYGKKKKKKKPGRPKSVAED